MRPPEATEVAALPLVSSKVVSTRAAPFCAGRSNPGRAVLGNDAVVNA